MPDPALTAELLKAKLLKLVDVLRSLGHDPDLFPGATADQIRQAQQVLGETFNAELLELYRLCNGSQRPLLAGLPLLSLQQMLAVNEFMQDTVTDNPGDDNFNPALYTSEPQDAVQPYYWLSGWVALAKEQDNYFCVDLNPGAAGSAGQVISCGRDEKHQVMAANLTEFMTLLCAGLTGGQANLEQNGSLRGADTSTAFRAFRKLAGHQG